MKKFKLNLNDLQITSFETSSSHNKKGTVNGNEHELSYRYPCDTELRCGHSINFGTNHICCPGTLHATNDICCPISVNFEECESKEICK